MKQISDRSGFAACVALSVLAHATLLFTFAPAYAPPPSRSGAEGFRMVRAVVAISQKPRVVAVRPETVRKISEAAVVSDETAIDPIEDKPVDDRPVEASPAPVIGQAGGVGDTSLPEGPDLTDGSAPGAGNEFLPFYKVDVRPEFLSKAELQYPSQARKLGKEGMVIIEADIDELGALAEVRIIKKAGFGFDEAAVAMIRGSRFAPAYAAGRPVPVRMRFTVNFRLKSR